MAEEITKAQETCADWVEDSVKMVPEVSLDNLNQYFNKKRSFLADGKKLQKLDKFLNKEVINQSDVITSFINELELATLNINEDSFKRPKVIALYGESKSGRSLVCKKIAEFVKANDSEVVEVKGGELIHELRIIGKRIEDNSLCQKQLFGDSPVIIIDDFNKMSANCLGMVADIFKEGEIQTVDGEIVDFSNSVFIITLPEDKSTQMGFSEGEAKTKPVVDGKIEPFVTSFRLNSFKKEIIEELLERTLVKIKENLKTDGFTFKIPTTFAKKFAADMPDKGNYVELMNKFVNKKVSPFILKGVKKGDKEINLEKLVDKS